MCIYKSVSFWKGVGITSGYRSKQISPSCMPRMLQNLKSTTSAERGIGVIGRRCRDQAGIISTGKALQNDFRLFIPIIIKSCLIPYCCIAFLFHTTSPIGRIILRRFVYIRDVLRYSLRILRISLHDTVHFVFSTAKVAGSQPEVEQRHDAPCVILPSMYMTAFSRARTGQSTK